MICIYEQKLNENFNSSDVMTTIKTMVERIRKANPDDYVNARFPRRYYEIVLNSLKQHDISTEYNISCEIHVVNNVIHLELVKHHERK